MNKLNSINLEYKAVRDLEVGRTYSASDFKTVTGNFGPQIECVLDNSFKINIPQRYAKLFTEDMINSFNESGINITYKGSKPLKNGNNCYICEFSE